MKNLVNMYGLSTNLNKRRPQVLLFFVFLFILESFAQELEGIDNGPAGADGERPTIIPPNETLDIPVGDNLSLICTGSRPIEWTKFGGEAIRNGEVSIVGAQLAPNQFRSNLVLQRTTVFDTGKYQCQYSDNENSIRSIKVFINDPNQLFVPPRDHPQDLPMAVTVNENQPSVVACLPTYSRAVVLLLLNGNRPIQTSDVVFDNSNGFTIFFPNIFFSGEFVCEYRVQINQQERKQRQNMILFYHADTEPPKPIIDKENARHVVAGKSFSLTCNATAQPGSFVQLKWNLPSPSTIRRSTVQPTHVEDRAANDYRYKFFRSIVTVHDVDEIQDNGAYTCESSYFSNPNKKSSTTVSIKPFSAGVESHTEVKTKQPIHKVIKAGSVTMVAEYNAYPSPLIKWKRGDVEVTARGRITRDDRHNFTSLKIVDVNGDDAGNYTVEITAGDGKAEINITLFVKEAPTVDLRSNSSQPFFMSDGHVDFLCHVVAFPPPHIAWLWQRCIDDACLVSKPDHWSRVPPEQYSTTVDARGRTTTSRFPVKFAEFGSGFIACSAENVISGRTENAQKEQRVLSTDVENGFQWWIEPKSPIEHQDIRLICKTNKYEYTSAIWEWRRSSRDDEYDPLSMSTTEEERLSRVTSMILPKATVDSNGEYRCRATLRSTNGFKRGQPITLNLLKAEPLVHAPHVLQDPYVQEADYQTSLRLDCTADGRPAPEYLWTKNDHSTPDTVTFENNKAIMIIQKITQDDNGRYKCIARNALGEIPKEWKVVVRGESAEERKRRAYIVGGSVGGVVLLLLPLLICLTFRWRKEKKKREGLEYLEKMLNNDTANPELIDPNIPLSDQIQLLPYDEKWEIPRDKLKLTNKTLGTGQFGRVVKAEAYGLEDQEDPCIVAVKMLKETADITQRKALLGEIKIMGHIGKHLNVVNLLGAVTKNMSKGEIYMVIEYCRYGSLREYLQGHQGNRFFNQVDVITGKLTPLTDDQLDALEKKHLEIQPEKSFDGRIVTTRDLISYGFQISCGMEYLAKHHVIHRDLAARNVLVAEDNVVKICDFGLARQEYSQYVKKNQAELPIKWMAVESIYENLFSAESDVWSFGVLLWELFTLGSTPYPGINIDSDFVERVRNGYRMERPYLSPKEIYEIMRHCWEKTPGNRPSFSALTAQLGGLMEFAVRKKYLDMNTPYDHFNETHNVDSGYLNDPVKRNSKGQPAMDVENEDYLRTYQLSPTDITSSHQPPAKPRRTIRPTGSQKALDAMELQPMLRSTDYSAPNPSRPGNMIENEDYLNDNFVNRPANLSAHNPSNASRSSGFHSDVSEGTIPKNRDARSNYLFGADMRKAPVSSEV